MHYELRTKDSALLPDVLRLFGVIVNLFCHVFEVVHKELLGFGVEHGLEADVVVLVRLKEGVDDDTA